MIDYVIFDLGGVLIDWNPRYLYRKLLPEPEVESFVQRVVPTSWHVQMDAGYPFAEAIAERLDEHPEHTSLIRAYVERWAEMLGGAIEGTVEILRALRGRGTPVYSLTNWSAETFHHAEARFEFLTWFEDILVSGRERIMKPDPAIYRRLLDRNALSPERGVFIDDVPENLEGAHAIGLDTIHFTSPEALRAELEARGLI
jgi:2-haloacid dehalogenase